MLTGLLFVLCRVWQNQRGVTMVGYALIVALLSVVVVATLNNVRQAIQVDLSTAPSGMN